MRVLFRKDVDGSSGDVYYEQYAGLSSETKPTMNIATGSEFFEVDTGKKYKFDELTNSWIEQPDLKSAFDNFIDGTPIYEEGLTSSALISGAYQANESAGSPTGNSLRKCYGSTFQVAENATFTLASSGAYQIGFYAFDSNGKCKNTPGAWLNDGTYNRTQIATNARGDYGYFSFVLRDPNNADINSRSINALDYCSLQGEATYTQIGENSIEDKSISYGKLTDELKSEIFGDGKTIDLFMFMGQSNMAGRGITDSTHTETAPTADENVGYEFRAISDPTKLYTIAEPFGVAENNVNGINDYDMKTGSMVTAFANAYYKFSKMPIIAVSASQGGTTISQWQTGATNSKLDDALQRLSDCVSYLTTNGFTIRHKYVLWCQGESDMDYSTSKADYVSGFDNMLSALISAGIEKLFMVRIGEKNVATTPNPYKNMIDWQTEIAQKNKNVVMVSTDFASMNSREMMKDQYHYYQDAYNEVGTYSGINCAIYVNTQKEPTMYDPESGGLYYSHKN